MSDYLPIVVAAPSFARDRLLQKNILPEKLFRNLATESLWEEHPGPAIYLWPYDIPYAESTRFLDEVTERVGDLPAFFGMDPKEAKDHQERMLSRILLGSIVVHILFLDNRKTDTTPDQEERNETYAQFCTFEEIIKWSQNLKKVLEVRLLNNESNSTHILVIISANQQVIATEEELEALNGCIGESFPGSIKPFQACYFMDLNLNPGETKKIIHSKYVWDVQVSRLLLALLLSQEKMDPADEENFRGNPNPLHEIAGVKVWRAEDCVYSIDQDTAQEVLKETLECASKKLMNQTCSQQAKWIRLEEDVRLDKTGLPVLEPNWKGDNKSVFSDWKGNAADTLSLRNCLHMMFYNWSDIPVESLKQDMLSPDHWSKSFAERKTQCLKWSQKPDNAPKDYTNSVKDFFSTLKSKPGILRGFITNMYDIMSARYEKLKAEKEQFWPSIAALEKQRLSAMKKLDEDSKEFEKAQKYYVGRGLGLLVLVTVTAFSFWIIWRVLGLFGAGFLEIFPKLLLLSGMVFAGAVAAYLLVMILHNFTGNHAASDLVKEYDHVDQLMIERDRKVKEMFFAGVLARDVLSLQNVRFRTLLLAKRILSILETELQPKLSSLSEDRGAMKIISPKADPLADPDGVRNAFLRMTREQKGPFIPNKDKFKQDDIIESYFLEETEKQDSFLSVWSRISYFDAENVGYYPAKAMVSHIRDFVRLFFKHISGELLKSIDIRMVAGEDVKSYLDQKKRDNISKDFLSASLADYYGVKTSYLFFSSSLEAPVDAVISATELRSFPSVELSKTTILALFFQEYSVRFALKKIPGKKSENESGKEYGQLTFEPSDGEA